MKCWKNFLWVRNSVYCIDHSDFAYVIPTEVERSLCQYISSIVFCADSIRLEKFSLDFPLNMI